MNFSFIESLIIKDGKRKKCLRRPMRKVKTETLFCLIENVEQHNLLSSNNL